jgi:single-strand DNA-binding protein
MGNLNQVSLLGRLGQDPELRYTQSQVPVCTISVATSDQWVDDQGNKQEKTEWTNCVCWNKTAENASKYLHKGSEVFVQGKLETRKWQDKEGNDRYSTEVKVFNLQFVGGRSEGQANKAPPVGDKTAPVKKDYDNIPNVAPGADMSAEDMPF